MVQQLWENQTAFLNQELYHRKRLISKNIVLATQYSKPPTVALTRKYTKHVPHKVSDLVPFCIIPSEEPRVNCRETSGNSCWRISRLSMYVWSDPEKEKNHQTMGQGTCFTIFSTLGSHKTLNLGPNWTPKLDFESLVSILFSVFPNTIRF